MTDNRIVKETARDPEREALGSVRGGLRATAKKAAKKVAKKAGRKKVAKKATPTSGKTTAAGKTADSAKTATAGKTVASGRAAAVDKTASTDKTATVGKKAATGKTVARVPASEKKVDRLARATSDAPASGPAGAEASAGDEASAGVAKSRPPKAEEGLTPASEDIDATSPASSRESEPSIYSPRPPGPVHPGAIRDSMQEQSDGMGRLLALWGPLIIVGFLVLVFRGGDEPEMAIAVGIDGSGPTPIEISAETAAASGADASEVATIDATAGTMRAVAASDAPPETLSVASSETSSSVRPENLSGASPELLSGLSPETLSGPSPETMETFDRGFALRTSMAGPPVLSGRGAGPGGPAVAPRAFYPSPPGPYRDPRYRGLPTGERWSSGGSGEWMWSAEGRDGARAAAGSDAPVRWVRCEAPYYWCPAPSNPAW